MKRILLSIWIISTVIFSSFGQNNKAGKEAAALADFEKAVAVIETNTDNSNFMSYEKEFV